MVGFLLPKGYLGIFAERGRLQPTQLLFLLLFVRLTIKAVVVYVFFLLELLSLDHDNTSKRSRKGQITCLDASFFLPSTCASHMKKTRLSRKFVLYQTKGGQYQATYH